jgi:O-antigen/teichoic acid export membrane protein
LGYGLSQIFRLAGNIILTKLLIPEMFGIMAIVNVLIMGMQMFSDIGLGPSIIQNKRGEDPKFINTAWSLQIIRGFTVWLFIVVVAGGLWFANTHGYLKDNQVYGYPLLPWLLVLSGSSAAIAGFNSTAIFQANRTLALGRLTKINLFSQVMGLCVMILIAHKQQTIWALPIGTIVSSLLDMILSHIYLPGIANRLCWEKNAVRELIHFGKWIFFSTALTFVANQCDKLILGRYLTPDMLGIYNIAFMLANVPASVLTSLSHKVLFPSLSKTYRDQPGNLKAKLIKSKKWLSLFVMPLTGILMVVSQYIIDMLYDDRYSDAGWMMQYLLFGVATSCLSIPNYIVMMAKGLPKYGTLAYVVKSVFLFSLLPFAYTNYGINKMILVIGVSGLGDIPILWYALIKHRLFSLRVEIYSMVLLVLGYIFASAIRVIYMGTFDYSLIESYLSYIK